MAVPASFLKVHHPKALAEPLGGRLWCVSFDGAFKKGTGIMTSAWVLWVATLCSSDSLPPRLTTSIMPTPLVIPSRQATWHKVASAGWEIAAVHPFIPGALLAESLAMHGAVRSLEHFLMARELSLFPSGRDHIPWGELLESGDLL